MVVALSLLGVLVGWILLVLLGLSAGYGIVFAWQRWGRQAPLPPQVRNVATRLLGPVPGGAAPRPVSAPASGPVDAAAPAAAAQDTNHVEGRIEGQEEKRKEEAGRDQQEAAQSADSAQQEGADGPGEQAALTQPENQEPDGPRPRAAAVEGKDGPTKAASTRSERNLEQVFSLDRADAVEEISILFDAPYDEANALVKSGLWGMENHDEWSRAMRGKEPPQGVTQALFAVVVNTSPKDYVEVLQKIREKRASMKDLRSLWGVGPEEAEALYKAGYRDIDAIRTTSTEKLAKVPGIGQALAFQMRAAAHGLAPAP